MVRFTDIYICPHNDSCNCNCRKPKPEMLIEVKLDYIAENLLEAANWIVNNY